MKPAEAKAHSAAAEARSTSVGSLDSPSAAAAAADGAAAAAAAKGDSSSTVGSRCCFFVDLCFYAALIVLAAVAGILYGLPPSNWLHAEVRAFVSSLSSSSFSPHALQIGKHIRDISLLLEGTAAAKVSPYLLYIASYPYIDAAAAATFTLFSLLFISCLLNNMIKYKKDRDIEVNPPAISYCNNKMTIEEYNKKEGTYAAVQELMASPEFQALKAQRASQGSEAWNWQRRVKRSAAAAAAAAAAASDSEDELLDSSEPEGTDTETETETAAA